MQILSIRDKQIVCIGNNLILFSGKNKKNIINLLNLLRKTLKINAITPILLFSLFSDDVFLVFGGLGEEGEGCCVVFCHFFLSFFYHLVHRKLYIN